MTSLATRIDALVSGIDRLAERVDAMDAPRV